MASFWDDNAIIPPRGEGHADVGYTRVIINSATRDARLYPSPASYSVTLPEDISQVLSVALLTSYFPFSATRVNAGNRRVPYRTPAGVLRSVSVPDGDYASLAALAAAVQSALQAHECTAAIAVSVTASDAVAFSFPGAYQLCFGSDQKGTLAGVLGFAHRTYDAVDRTGGGTTYVVDAGGRADLDHYNRSFSLYVDPLEAVLSTDDAIARCFTVIYKHKMDAALDHRGLKTFKTPLARIARISVRLVDRGGGAYDPRGQDHVFELLVKHHKSSARNRF